MLVTRIEGEATYDSSKTIFVVAVVVGGGGGCSCFLVVVVGFVLFWVFLLSLNF